MQDFLSSYITWLNSSPCMRNIWGINFTRLTKTPMRIPSNLSVWAQQLCVVYTLTHCHEKLIPHTQITCSGLPFISTFTKVRWSLLKLVHKGSIDFCPWQCWSHLFSKCRPIYTALPHHPLRSKDLTAFRFAENSKEQHYKDCHSKVFTRMKTVTPHALNSSWLYNLDYQSTDPSLLQNHFVYFLP